MDTSPIKHESRALTQSRDAPALARRFVTSTLDTWGVAEAFADVPLVTSELVTNTVQHAGTDVDVTLDLTPDRLRLEVSDCSQRPPVMGDIDARTTADGASTSSRRSRARWGLEARSNGKTVWCEVAAPGAVVRRDR